MAAGDHSESKDFAEGQVAGTGSALNVYCGFKPRGVRLINRTQLSTVDWVKSMGDANAVYIKDTGAGTSDTFSITSLGITPLFNGFTIGATANFNTASDAIHYMAWR
jgi:hypothetical protein